VSANSGPSSSAAFHASVDTAAPAKAAGGGGAAAAAAFVFAPSSSGAPFVSSAVSFPAASFPASLEELRPSEQGLGGSGGAQLLVHPGSGQRYVLKYKNSAPAAGAAISQAAVEFLANRVYARMGVLVPEACLYDSVSQQRVPESAAAAVWTSQSLLLLVVYLPGLQTAKSHLAIPMHSTGRSLDLNAPSWRQKLSIPGGQLSSRLQSVRTLAASGFLIDCLLANWDVCGWLFDNLLLDSSARLWRLDQGGCCIYRAKGTLKSADRFGAEVHELNSFRDAAINPNAHFLYAGISQTEVQTQVLRLKEQKEAILRLFPSGSALRGTMAARLEYLLSNQWQNAWRKEASFVHSQ